MTRQKGLYKRKLGYWRFTPGSNIKANLVDVVRADWGQLSFTKGNLAVSEELVTLPRLSWVGPT
jgi:hypothetical protein